MDKEAFQSALLQAAAQRRLRSTKADQAVSAPANEILSFTPLYVAVFVTS